MSESRKRSIAKGLSWRITGTIDTIVLSYVVTGSLKQASVIGALEVVTKFALYYLHERMWNRIDWEKESFERKNT